MSDYDPIFQKIDQDAAASHERVRQMLYAEGRPDLVAMTEAEIEAVARAIYDVAPIGVRTWEDAPAATREDCIVCARAAIEALDRAREAAEPTDTDIERVVKADFMVWGVYGGYTKEAKEAEWQRMKGIEMGSFKRRYRAMLAARPR